MQSHEFYQRYANTPLNKRFIPLNTTKAGLTTLYDIYKQVNELEDKMRPDVIKIQNLLNLVSEYHK